MTQALADLLQELEIKAISIQRYRGPMETMAVETMENILRQRGYSNLKLTLTSIVETAPNNRREIVACTLWAVSDLILAHPHWAARVSDWLKAFDRVDLGQLRSFAKKNRRAVRPRAGMAAILYGLLVMELELQKELI